MNVHTYYLLIVPAWRSPAENVVTMLSSNGNHWQILELTYILKYFIYPGIVTKITMMMLNSQESFSLCLKLFLHSEIRRLKQMERIRDQHRMRCHMDADNHAATQATMQNSSCPT